MHAESKAELEEKLNAERTRGVNCSVPFLTKLRHVCASLAGVPGEQPGFFGTIYFSITGLV